jgi:hypothetical protein
MPRPANTAVEAAPWTPTDDDLRMLTEHLFYEVQMTFHLAAVLHSTQGTVLDQLVRNAQIEAFTIHVRQLIDFFWMERSRKGKKRDAFAADYFAPGEWVNIRPQRSDVLNEALRHKVGWGVAHLTYGRARSTVQDKQWQPIALACALAPAVICFADNVDHAKLDGDWPVSEMRPHAEWFLAQFGAFA